LYLGRGIPRAWLGTGKEISIKQAPTRWGRVDYEIRMASPSTVAAKVRFSEKVPREFEVKLRLPKSMRLGSVSVNGQDVPIQKNEAVLVKTDGKQKEFVVEAKRG